MIDSERAVCGSKRALAVWSLSAHRVALRRSADRAWGFEVAIRLIRARCVRAGGSPWWLVGGATRFPQILPFSLVSTRLVVHSCTGIIDARLTA